MRFETPFGPAWASVNTDGALTEFSFREFDDAPTRNAKVERQINEFFAGKRPAFDFPLAPEGTAFQRRVWMELLNIPFAETISYGELARRVGNPNASRAVGSANGQNPIAVIVPCHRVIGADGKLTGYGGGLDLKDKLLTWERAVAGKTALLF